MTQESLDPGRCAGGILAYLDRWSVRPGDTLQARVSCTAAGQYRVRLVRIHQGDSHPLAPAVQLQPIELDLGGPHPARVQPIRTGSYALVDDHPALDAPAAGRLQLDFLATRPGGRPQTLWVRRDPGTGAGVELYLDADGCLCGELEAAGQRCRLRLPPRVAAGGWHRATLTWNRADGRARLELTRLHPGLDAARADDCEARLPTGLDPAAGRGPILFAARRRLDDAADVERLFNGRLARPRFEQLQPAGPRLLAAWDFSQAISSTRCLDTGPLQLHGCLVNLPTRGLPGPDWQPDQLAWPVDASGHDAIHFHDDDLYDAGWTPDLSVTLPETLASGVYALRFEAGDEVFHTPFCLRPPAHRPCKPLVFLLPTASYLAYANNRIGLDVPETELVCGQLLELTPGDLYMQEHPELGRCFYDLHNDGSGVFHSSRLRPVLDFQPGWVGKLGGRGSNVWQFNADTHLLGWLQHTGADYDVVSDEDLHHEGLAALAGCRVLVTGTHPEYYSAAMRDALDGFLARGGRLMYPGGNGFYWRIAFHPELPGVIECRKSEDGIRASAPEPGAYYSAFTGEYTGLWRRNGRPPNALTGVGMVAQGFDHSAPYERTAASDDPRVGFMFEGIPERTLGDAGLCGGGAAGIELDAADPALGTPAHALVVARSSAHGDTYLQTPEDMLDPAPGLGGTESASIRADLVFFETPAGGAVFSTGSIAWAGAMAWNAYDNPVARLTGNVLKRFLDPTAFAMPPATGD